MQPIRNAFKAGLKEGRFQTGLWSNLRSPMVAELLSHAPFDWLLIDMEHGPNTLGDVVAQLQAMRAGSVSAAVRPPWNDRVIIKQLLDAGAQTLIVPFVETVEEAEAAVAATRYPPAGIRGVAGGTRAMLFGEVENYHATADAEICLIVQMETAGAAEQVDKIAAVDGIDAVFIGPADLAASLGLLGEREHPKVQAIIETSLEHIHGAGKAAGILSFDPKQATTYARMGFDFVAVGSDQSLLRNGARALAERFAAFREKSR